MSKVYLIKTDRWEESSDTRITVPNDTICQVNNYEGNGSSVKFTREVDKYEHDTLAVFSNIHSCVLQDELIMVESRRYVEDEKAAAKCEEACSEVKGEWTWIDPSKK